jgi:hypothetical protein
MNDAPVQPEPEFSHQDMIDAILFKRNLDEVFLLLDFVSGRPDKNLLQLTVPDPVTGQALTPQQVVCRLADIRYPPQQTAKQRSADAAFLMLAKDRLTGLASPARGLTIAYTALFSGSELMSRTRHWFGGTSAGWGGRAAPDASRATLAESAFPSLSAQVYRFNIWFGFLMILTLIWLMLTALTYWDVALGRSYLLRMDDIHKDRETLYQAVPSLVTADCAKPTTENAVNCRKVTDLSAAEASAKQDLAAFSACGGAGCSSLFHPLHWNFAIGSVQHDSPVDEQPVSALLSLFSNYVLPMMFGVLGTFIAAIRAVQTKVRDSELSPRDLWSTVLALPLSMVAGVAVGLFFSPSSAPATGTATLAGNLTLTASGLGFLAGYGSQAFFTMLDALQKKAFPANGDAAKAPVVPGT